MTLRESTDEQRIPQHKAPITPVKWTFMFSFMLACTRYWVNIRPLQWRHNERDSVSNHQPHDCLLNRLFRRRSKKTSNLRVTGLCVGNSPGNSPHKWPVTRKMFPLDDVIMVRGISRWPVGSPHKAPVTPVKSGFYVFVDVRVDKLLGKHSSFFVLKCHDALVTSYHWCTCDYNHNCHCRVAFSNRNWTT